jgi:hypothetical protein
MPIKLRESAYLALVAVGGRGARGRRIRSTATVRIRRLLQLNALLLWGCVLRTEVAVVLRVRAVLWRRILLIVRVAVGRLLVDWLVWRRRSWRRSHPSGSCERALAMSSATACVEASGTRLVRVGNARKGGRTHANPKKSRKATPTITANATQRPQESQVE